MARTFPVLTSPALLAPSSGDGQVVVSPVPKRCPACGWLLNAFKDGHPCYPPLHQPQGFRLFWLVCPNANGYPAEWCRWSEIVWEPT